jgi:hypothetical protein
MVSQLPMSLLKASVGGFAINAAGLAVRFLVIFLERYKKITMFFQEVSSGFAFAARARGSRTL